MLGIMVSLPINDVQELLGHKRTHLLGQYAGVVYICCSPFMLGGALISGVLVERFDVQVAPGIWCAACFVVGGCVILAGLCMENDTSCFEDDSQTETCQRKQLPNTSGGNNDAVQMEAEPTDTGTDAPSSPV